ncbi:MAG: M4 family metallopeptidase [Planctomycetes bacterium]|nr:M4 family metallopeptidase [Planctomycetota bacterium]
MPAGTIPVSRTDPVSFLHAHGALFGLSDPARQLVADPAGPRTDALGYTHTSFRQVHRGVPVFSGVLRVHQNAGSHVTAANGDFYPVADKLNVTPRLTPNAATVIAAARLPGPAAVEHAELVIVDPGWYGDPPRGPHLAYHLILGSAEAGVREAFFVEGQTGEILDQWSVLPTARVRSIYSAGGTAALPGTLRRSEGQPPVSSPPDVNRAYDYSGDTYDYFARAFGRDSLDDLGLTLVLTANSVAVPCPNAQWNGGQSLFCTGTAADDVVGHELVHGLTQFTADLIYQNQPGQLNESFSDVFGELVDLFNGNAAFVGPAGGTPWPVDATYVGSGRDLSNLRRSSSIDACNNSTSYTNGVRWMVAEDATAFLLAIRDMWNPTCRNDPSTANSSLQTCDPDDNGGVHSGSGVPNHAFAMLTDGKNFNGQAVTGIGPIKAGAVWYRALTEYLTPASDFADAYVAFNQAAADLIGTTPNDPRTGAPSTSAFTAADAAEVNEALLAVEMNTQGRCGASADLLNPASPATCTPRVTLFRDQFDSGINGWAVSNTNPPTDYNWLQTPDLPAGRQGTAWYCPDPDVGNCTTIDESAVHTLISPSIALPGTIPQPTLAFTHYFASETGWDGGNVRVRVNGGPWQLVARTDFTYNPYNTTLNTAGAGNSNPMAGEPAFTGVSGKFGTSLVNLSRFVSGGETIQVRFDFGKDACAGIDGWYLTDFEVFVCGCDAAAGCDDGRFCNGPESCVDLVCHSGAVPCPGTFCDESTHSCLDAVFSDDFESGNIRGWTIWPTAGGDWTIGDPVGTLSGGAAAQPENAFDGLGCAFTGQNTTAEEGDVDGGETAFISARVDLSTAYHAELSFLRWFFNRDLGEDPDDYLALDISSDDGASWFNLDALNYQQSANAWTRQSFALEDYMALTNAVRIRFRAADGPTADNVIEAAIDNVVIATTGECNDDGDCADTDACTDDFCDLGVCAHGGATCGVIVDSDPPSGAIDARQPHAPASPALPQGWDSVDLVYSGGDSGSVRRDDLALSETGGDGTPPLIASVSPLGPTGLRVSFSRPIEPGAWTVLTDRRNGRLVCLGALPGDVDGSRRTVALDILALVDSLNNVPGAVLPAYATDINRSGVPNAQDITRLVDLLNGAGAFSPWVGRQLPASPCD